MHGAVPQLSMAGLDPATQTAQAAATPQGHVYILASKRNSTLYIGVTNNLAARIFAHREGRGSTFTRKYGVKRLVWYETYDMVADAIQRETSLKRWPRKWKLDLIEKSNPEWSLRNPMTKSGWPGQARPWRVGGAMSCHSQARVAGLYPSHPQFFLPVHGCNRARSGRHHPRKHPESGTWSVYGESAIRRVNLANLAAPGHFIRIRTDSPVNRAFTRC